MDAPLTQQSIDAFLTALGSDAPTPGGGAAAALSGALAAQLGHKAGALTVGKKKYAEVEDDVKDLMQRLAKADSMLRQLITEDAIAYDGLSSAFKLPKDQDDRSDRIAAAATYAAGVPLQTVAVARRVLRTLEKLGPICNTNLKSDVEVGIEMARGAMQSGAINVRINLPFVPEQQRDAVASELNQLLELGSG